MLKKSSIVFVSILLLAVMAIGYCCLNGTMSANAAEVQDEVFVTEKVEMQNAEVEPRLLTTLSLSIGGLNGEVWANVKNEFTLGFSTVRVYVQLYSSYTYQESYTNMTFESQTYIEDLNIFETVRTAATTNGEQKYWMARARYRINSGNWEEKISSLWLFDGNGNKVD